MFKLGCHQTGKIIECIESQSRSQSDSFFVIFFICIKLYSGYAKWLQNSSLILKADQVGRKLLLIMIKFYLWFLILIANLMQHQSIDLEFFGNYLNDDQNWRDELCVTKECLLDAGRLAEGATRQWSSHPCVDFLEFSMGNFIKFRALHERYDRR